VHGAGGNVLNFSDLARRMSSAQPFYALQASGVDGERPPHESIDEMASAYLGEVREMQPHGPYLLGGYSGGGLVAFGMAQKLTTAGERVGLLALIDTYGPNTQAEPMTLRSRVDRLRIEGSVYVAGAIRRQLEERRTSRSLKLLDACLARGQTVPFALRDLHLVRSFRRAAMAYAPRPWPGHATLFRAERVPYTLRSAGPAYGWDQVILGGVEIVRVPGSHHSLLLGMNADLFARSLSDAVERAQPR
jgi:thioesterase domain-containing protein